MKAQYELRCTTWPSSILSVHDFIDQYLTSLDPENNWLPDVHVIADDLASNIEKFAYGSEHGSYLFRIKLDGRRLEIDFEDCGKEFDPTKVREDPIDGHYERPVGNLGILLVMRLTDEMRYSRCDGRNITTIAINIPRMN